MPSKQEKREKRGYVEKGRESNFSHLTFEEKQVMLQSENAQERTIGARLLKNNISSSTVPCLIEALEKEQKLYTKIEISNTLVLHNEIAIITLIECLGTIGNNHHKSIPKKEFLKVSYPLPRDIASRTLIRIGPIVMPKLLSELCTDNISKLSELIDTIGHINFYTKSENIFEPLKAVYLNNKTDVLIQWKIIRAYSGVEESRSFLKEIYSEIDNIRLQKEVHRSLLILDKRSAK